MSNLCADTAAPPGVAGQHATACLTCIPPPVSLPVRVGGLMVNQGDLLHADANGVTNIPIEIASEVADIGPEFLAAEELVMNYVKSQGEKSVTRYNELRVFENPADSPAPAPIQHRARERRKPADAAVIPLKPSLN